jgi:hypothetical protein
MLDGRVRYVLVVLTSGAALGGCTDPGCTTELRFGLAVDVRRAATGESLAGIARGAMTDGAFTDSLQTFPGGVTLVGAGERAGTYAVHLEAAGYQPWDTTGVVVGRDECEVHPVALTAGMRPLAAFRR